jgi:hypothetical protein
MGVSGQDHAGSLYPLGKDQVLTLLETVNVPVTVYTGAENLSHIGIRSLDRLALSESLYGLRFRRQWK